jgi:hypothetical protein
VFHSVTHASAEPDPVFTTSPNLSAPSCFLVTPRHACTGAQITLKSLSWILTADENPENLSQYGDDNSGKRSVFCQQGLYGM